MSERIVRPSMDDRRPCTKCSEGEQVFFQGFDRYGRLLDNETGVTGTWECLKCGHREEQKGGEVEK